MGLPFLGETLDFLRIARRDRPWEFLEDRVSGYGSETFKTSLLGFPTVVLASPAGNKMAFANIHVSWPKSVVDVTGSHSLIAHTGSHAHHLRHALHAFLNPYALQRYTHPLSRIVLASLPHPPHINNITSSSASRSSPPPAEIELLAYPFMKKLSFSIVCHILVGIRVAADQDSLFHHFSTLVRGLFQIPIKIPGTRYSKAIAAASAIKKTIKTVIDKKRVEIASAESAAVSEHQDVLSGLLNFKDEDGKALSEEEIKDNIVLLLFAGNDTSSITATMASRYLALHPSIMDEVYEENKEIAEDKGPGEYHCSGKISRR
ncbi:hypothetical protein KP509_28G033600 [Ceratopteris richardii]|uniref:Cytochrome P450 n=1 Tax=Ceratopteris richardii TaxID=49495 RepID=A0A8T2RCP7_CERRI|nr:hypothetical protein KP509_28G033600 [Ceratopteris richardii]